MNKRGKLQIVDSRGYIYYKERTKSTGIEEFPKQNLESKTFQGPNQLYFKTIHNNNNNNNTT